jgi:hypothetical protein
MTGIDVKMKKEMHASKKRNKSVLLHYLLYIVKLSQTWKNLLDWICYYIENPDFNNIFDICQN